MTITVRIDTDRDLSFASNVSALLEGGDVMVGTEDRYDDVYPPNTAQLRFTNIDGEFDDLGVERGMRLRVYGGPIALPSTLFVGHVDQIITSWHNRHPVVTLFCVSRLAFVYEARVSMPVMQDTSVDKVLEELFARAFEPGQALDAIYLGYQGVLGTGKLGGGESGFEDIEEGLDTIAYIGDTWSETTGVERILRDLVTGAGVLYETATGILTFRNRHYAVGTASGLEMSTGDCEATYRDAAALRRVEVRVNPRSTENEVEVFRQRSTYRLVEGFSMMRLQARNDNGEVLAVLGNAWLDGLTVYDGRGGDTTADVSYSILTNGQTIIISWQNSSGRPGYVQPDMTVIATALISWDTYNIVIEEDRRSDLYGGRSLVVSLPYIDDAGVAADFANWLYTRENETGRYLEKLTFDERAGYGGQMTTGLWAHVEVDETDGYYLVGVRHRLTPGKIQTEWYLRPDNPGPYVVIGRLPYLGYGRLAL